MWVLGCLLGRANFSYTADFLKIISNKSLPLSSIRVKKFVSATEFSSKKFELDAFKAPFSIIDGIERTLESEFLSPDHSQEIFYTE